MIQSSRATRAVVFIGGVTLMAATARADIFRDIAFGLGYANFNIEAQHNRLSGGDDFLINTNFVGNPLDFGIADLTLRGPVSLALSTGGRGIPELEFSVRTALDAQSQAVPLNFLLNVDAGGQESQIGGTLFVDASFKVNGFGFYDLELMYSSRQTVSRSGRFADDSQDFDEDIGPINISGNIIADLLAALTDPFFQSTNTVNIFDAFSGRAQLEKLIQGSNDTALTQIAATGGLVANAIPVSPTSTGVDRSNPSITERFPGSGVRDEAGTPSLAHVIPEPAVIVLLLLGMPAVILGSRRRTVSC